MKKRIVSLLTAVGLTLSLAVTPALAANAPVSFTDVDANAWYSSYVQEAAEEGLMSGVSAGTFNPEGTLTRAMFVTVLGRMAEVDVADYTGSAFADVPRGEWYAPYVAWAVKLGVTNGTSETTFAPDQPVTREQMAAFVGRWLERMKHTLPNGTTVTAQFTDYKTISGYAYLYVDAIRAAGILTGQDDGSFAPQDSATRAQAAKVFVLLADSVKRAKRYTVSKDAVYDIAGRLTQERLYRDYSMNSILSETIDYTYGTTGNTTQVVHCYYNADGVPLVEERTVNNTDGTQTFCRSCTNAAGDPLYSVLERYQTSGVVEMTEETDYTYHADGSTVAVIRQTHQSGTIYEENRVIRANGTISAAGRTTRTDGTYTLSTYEKTASAIVTDSTSYTADDGFVLRWVESSALNEAGQIIDTVTRYYDQDGNQIENPYNGT